MNEDMERLLEQLRPFEGRLTNHPATDFALRDTTGRSLGEILHTASDEALAGVVALTVCSKVVFEELFICRYKKKLLNRFLLWGVDNSTARDLFQGVCTKMLRGGLQSYNPDRDFRPFLYVAARNLYISEVHRRRRPIPGSEGLEKPGPDLTAETVACRDIEAAVDQLPEEQRMVLRLSMEDHTAAEIAKQTGLTESRVYEVRKLARDAVAKKLGLKVPSSTRGRPRKDASVRLPTGSEPNQKEQR
jgi:RNA polymerase sigma factor (sigma-70 family)